MTMIEQVAKAIAESCGDNVYNIIQGGLAKERRELVFMDLARAAVEAMQEPSNEMVDAAFVDGPLSLSGLDGSKQAQAEREHVREIHRAMLSAALKEG